VVSVDPLHTLYEWLSQKGPGVSLDLGPWLKLLVVCVVLVALVYVLRMVLTRRVLRTRRWLRIRATDSFDPTESEIEILGREFTNVPPQARNWLTRPATAVRIQFRSEPGGRMSMRAEVAKNSEQAMVAAMTSLDQVQCLEDEP
jgi:hypothetical protein